MGGGISIPEIKILLVRHCNVLNKAKFACKTMQPSKLLWKIII